MFLLVTSAALALLMQSGPAYPGPASPAAGASNAQPSALQSGATEPSASSDDNQVVCREEMETGSRFTKRICHTGAEWRQINEDAQAEVGNFQRSSKYSTPH